MESSRPRYCSLALAGHDLPLLLTARGRLAAGKAYPAGFLLAVVNGTLEEALWRGISITLFPDQLWLAVVYPTLGFERPNPWTLNLRANSIARVQIGGESGV